MKKYFYVMQPTAIVLHKRSSDGNILTRTLFLNKITENIFAEVSDLLNNDKCKKAWKALKNAFKNEIDLGQYSLDFESSKIFDKSTGQYLNDKLSKTVIDYLKGFSALYDAKADLKIESLVNFLQKLHESDSYHILEELLDFIQYNDIEISADGNVICYKVVDKNYKDIYTHTIDNNVGQVVKMNRNQVSDDRNKSCSFGLHVASLQYLKSSGYGCDSPNNHLMKLSVHPKDFVSVPYDYDGAKARVCEYTVIEEVDMDLIETAF